MLHRILISFAIVLVFAACAPMSPAQARGDYYERGCENCGRVVRIESIGQRDNRLGGGTVLGAIVGGALGNQVGKGTGNVLATVAGAVIGGIVGSEIGRSMDEQDRRPVARPRVEERSAGRRKGWHNWSGLGRPTNYPLNPRALCLAAASRDGDRASAFFTSISSLIFSGVNRPISRPAESTTGSAGQPLSWRTGGPMS